MKRKYLKYLLPVLTSFVILFSAVLNLNFRVFADGAGSDATCSSTDTSVDPGDNETQTPFVVNFDAGSGNIVTGVCIKSGSNMFGGNQHSTLITANGTVENGCYTISGIGTQFLTVTRNLSSSNCQGISHLDIEIEPVASPSPSPSPSPSVSPSPSPSASSSPSPSPNPSASPSPSPSVSPSPSPSPTPSPSPSPTPYPSPSPTPNPSPSPSPSPSPTPYPTPTPSPSVSPTPSPVPSPSPSPDDECNGICDNTGGVPSPSPSASPSPSSSPSPTPTPTPSPGPSPSPTSGDQGGTTTSSQPSSQGEVLGAKSPTVLADTGFDKNLISLVMGFASIGLGFTLIFPALLKKES